MPTVRGASAVVGLALAWLASCRPGPRQAPPPVHEAPARTIELRTGRFELVASAYVDLALELAEDEEEELPATSSAELAACADDRCAARAAGPREADFRARLPEFLRSSWGAEAARARRAMQVAEVFLTMAEDPLALRLGSDFGFAWPREPVVIVIAPRDASGQCYAGAAVLVCCFEQAVRAVGREGALLRAFEDERARLDADARRRTEDASDAIVAFAVRRAVREIYRAYDERRGPASSSDPASDAWLARAWPDRVSGKLGAEDFGRLAARELARATR